MVQTTEDWRGIVIELTHEETQNFLGTLGGLGGAATTGGVAAALTAVGIAATAVPIVAGVLALHLAWQIPAIKSMDQGDGVILTMPWFMPGVLIPSTRHPSDINQNWAASNDGEFKSIGGDIVQWKIERGIHNDPEGVSFTLVNKCQSGWDKIVVIRDGEGGSWEIRGTKNHAGENGLWAHQCDNGQQFTFRKPSFAGRWINVFSIGGLGALQPKDKVTFTWIKD